MSDVLRFPTPSSLEVVEADPFNPPTPPAGAHAVEIRDAIGRTVSYGWVIPEIEKEAFHVRAFKLRDAIAPLLMLASDLLRA